MNQEIFLLEQDGIHIIFAPLLGLIFEINDSEKRELSRISKKRSLIDSDIFSMFSEIDVNNLLNKYECKLDNHNDNDIFCPSSAVIFTTFDCNLKCSYCYSDAGKRKINMTWEIAKRTIDFILENAKKIGVKESFLEFHGGGEPTYNWKIFIETLNYFKSNAIKLGINPNISLATNGMLSSDQIQWVVDNVDSIQVSLDGPSEIQNIQRPIIDLKESYSVVSKTVKSLLYKNIDVTIHAVVTNDCVSVMPETMKFFTENFPKASVHFEPVCGCGRGLKTKQKFPNRISFIKGFIEAEKIARDVNVNIFYSGLNFALSEFRENFCSVSAPNFTVTPDGLVTACHEIADLSHPLASTFIYGHLSQNGEFIFDNKKISSLRGYGSRKSQKCEKCFAQYYCGGECLSKRLQQVTSKDSEFIYERCIINRELLRHRIFQKLHS